MFSHLLGIDTANPDDPNELSFQKEEVLEILNKSGNWWQAKKQDGTIGIVPSNYVSCSIWDQDNDSCKKPTFFRAL